MSILGIDVDSFVNLKDVQNGLRRLQLAGKDLRPVWRKTRKDMRADMREHAKDQAGSSGAWPSLARSTVERRRVRPRKTGRARKKLPSVSRKMLGRLPGAFKIDYDANRIRAASRVPWSWVHNAGGKAGHRARINKREFLWVSQALLRRVARNAVDYLVGAWDKGV